MYVRDFLRCDLQKLSLLLEEYPLGFFVVVVVLIHITVPSVKHVEWTRACGTLPFELLTFCEGENIAKSKSIVWLPC